VETRKDIKGRIPSQGPELKSPITHWHIVTPTAAIARISLGERRAESIIVAERNITALLLPITM
jgi:hypothetical protein